MKALIIGANGFLGRHICHAFLNNSWKVEGVYHANKDMIPGQAKIHHVSGLENLPRNYDVVFLTVGNFTSSISELLETNVVLTKKVIKRFVNSKIIFISSTTVYGLHKNKINISSPFNQPGSYGWSKLAGEFITQTHKNASIIRFTTLYGPGMNDNLFIPIIIEQARKEKVIKILGDGKRKQDYFFVKDAASMCFRVALHKKAGVYLGASGKSFSNNQIARIVTSYFPETDIIYTGKDEHPSFAFDILETKNELGFSPVYSLKKGVEEMVKFYE